MDALRRAGDSCGARIEVVADGVPVGLGEPLFDKLDADIAYAMMGINAVKGVEIGAGFGCVTQKGSEHGDELTPEGFASNHAGGVLGGISTGQPIVVSIAVKPTSSIRVPRRSIDSRRADHGRDPRPPRSLRRHPCHADRRGDAGAGVDGPRVARSRTERRRLGGHAAHRRPGAARHTLNSGGIKALFLAYFTYVGLFSPYLSLYLAALGLTIAQIGVLMAVPQVLRIVGPPFWGWLADRGGSRALLPLRVPFGRRVPAGAAAAAGRRALRGTAAGAGAAVLHDCGADADRRDHRDARRRRRRRSLRALAYLGLGRFHRRRGRDGPGARRLGGAYAAVVDGAGTGRGGRERLDDARDPAAAGCCADDAGARAAAPAARAGFLRFGVPDAVRARRAVRVPVAVPGTARLQRPPRSACCGRWEWLPRSRSSGCSAGCSSASACCVCSGPACGWRRCASR